MPSFRKWTRLPAYVIRCDNENSSILSNRRELVIWQALEKLLEVLRKDSNFASEDVLRSWKQPHHLAAAKEPYAWRAALEEIKNNDLSAKCNGFATDPGTLVLMTDKPAMLKVAGEVTNALLHSYTSRHRITFAQSDS